MNFVMFYLLLGVATFVVLFLLILGLDRLDRRG